MKQRILFIIIAFFLFIVVSVGMLLYISRVIPGSHAVATFEQCVAAGNPVQESYPRQCRAGGKTFAEDIGNELEKTNLIRVTTPRPNTQVKSPLAIQGEARGTWFFEGSFPVTLFDENGEVLATGVAQTKGEWMTEEFVPFTVELTFPTPVGTKGQLILAKDNPSGLAQNADSLRIPVTF